MRLHRCPFLPLLVLSILAVAARPAFSQNLLVNPGFDRDLSGWTVVTTMYPSPLPGYIEASAGWVSSDANGSAVSGGTTLHAKAGIYGSTTAAVTQCIAITEGMLVSFGARFLTTRQYSIAGPNVIVNFFLTTDCSGAAVGSARTELPGPSPTPPTEASSGGNWRAVASQTLATSGTRSLRIDVAVGAAGEHFWGPSYVDAVADEAFLTAAPATLTTSLLPAAAWIHGATGSYWTTTFTLVNPGSTDAAVTLKWLGHDVDGRSGPEFTYVVRAGQTLSNVEANFQANFQETWGGILMTSSSPLVFLQSETSTNVPSGGTVGQALPALGPVDFAGAAPRTLAPIKENASFRTNLVLANATEMPLVAHVALFAADGAPLGTRDVELPPLGATQINRVASALGSATLESGRIAVSTPTPGGLVAAYASLIDNITNDPRTLLPQDAAAAIAASTSNLLSNSGFDVDVSGWQKLVLTLGYATSSAEWSPPDASGNPASGSLDFHAFADIHGGVEILRWQCVPVTGGDVVTFGAKFLTARQSPGAGTSLGVGFFPTAECWDYWKASPFTSITSLTSPSSGETSSRGAWLSSASSTTAPPDARSMGVYVRAFASGYYGAPYSPSRTGYVDAAVDDIFVAKGPLTRWLLPSAAWIHGSGGSYWTTRFTMTNPGTGDASITLKWLGHDADGMTGRTFPYAVSAGQTVSVPVDDWVTNFTASWGAVLATSKGSILFQSDTSTPSSDGGTVGQALAAMGPADFASASPKTLAPIRENASFRTNLVLANPTENPVTAHVALFAADGTPIATRDVDLPPLGMTQINRVASTLGAGPLDAGRIAVSTRTPGGLIAAYASVIDNRTNDPRTLLPR